MFFVTKKKYNAALIQIAELEAIIASWSHLDKQRMYNKHLTEAIGKIALAKAAPAKVDIGYAYKPKKKPYKSVEQAVLDAMVPGVTYTYKEIVKKVYQTHGKRPNKHSVQCAFSTLTAKNKAIRVEMGKYKLAVRKVA